MSTGPHKRLEIAYRSVDDLRPYENNPRLNEAAIEPVMESLLEFGFRIPIVIDAEGVIVAGHTRILAAQRILERYPDRAAEFEEVPVLVADDLTPEQLNAFRLVDNKVAEIATWDFDKLSTEIAALTDLGIDFTSYGWTREEIDCLHNVVSLDCLTHEASDGVNGANTQRRTHAMSADGTSVRIAFGSLAFFVLKDDFDKWNDQVHKEHGYNAEAVIDDVAKRLGLFDAMQKRNIAVGAVTQESHEQQQVVTA